MVVAGVAGFPKDEESSLLSHDASNEGGGIELQDYNRKPAPPAAPLCGGCMDAMETSGVEASCPGCDCPMHLDCGTPVGTDDSPFRLCLDCDGSTKKNHKPGKSRTGIRRRGSSLDTGEDSLAVVSHLMSRPAADRKPSKPTLMDDRDEWPPKLVLPNVQFLSFVTADHSVYFLAVLMIVLVLITSYESNTATPLSDDDVVTSPVRPASDMGWTMVTPINTTILYQDSWWMAATEDNYLAKKFVTDDFEDKLTALRDVTFASAGIYSVTCGRYRFDLEKFPQVSIIIGPVYEGYPIDLLSTTVHSILARTPSHLIAEILIVHDNAATNSGIDDLDAEFKRLTALSQLISILQPRSPSTPANRVLSRYNAMLAAKAEYLIFVDPYVEVWSGTWLQQLLLPLLEDPRTLSVAMVHEMNSQLELKKEGDKSNYMLMMDEELKLKRVYVDLSAEYLSNWKAYPTPFFDGHLFAVRKDEILNSVDRGLKFMDGENIALALKFWMCRARIVQVPCVRVGIVLLSEFPIMTVPETLIEGNGLRHNGKFLYRGTIADDRTKLAVRNYMRIVRIWLPAIKDEWYNAAFGSPKLPTEWDQFVAAMNDNDINIELMEDLRDKCQDLEWFDKHVLMSVLGVHHPWYSGDKNE